MPLSSSVTVLSVGQNGQITIPVDFRKEHALSGGGKVIAVRMGKALVVAPHDAGWESICQRLEGAMKAAGETVESLNAQTLVERAAIVEQRYPRHRNMTANATRVAGVKKTRGKNTGIKKTKVS
jgi:bifunctional DNA-binding transcriptional regulator/antitoxin component of YhaV-PrlF toxin-antitoxin module